MGTGRRWPLHVLLLCCVIVAGILALGGLRGGDDEPRVSAGVISQAAATTGQQETARIALAMEAGGQTLAAEGVLRMDGSAMQVTYTSPELAGTEMRKVGDTMYLRMPQARELFGAEWVSLDVTETESGDEDPFGSSDDADPTAALASLAGTEDVQDLGRDDVRAGVATHYTVVVDAERAAQGARDRGEDLSEDEIEELRLLDGTRIDVWVRDDGLIVKLRYQMAVDTELLTTTFELYEFGVPVDVQAPPASETVDFSSGLMREQPISA